MTHSRREDLDFAAQDLFLSNLDLTRRLGCCSKKTRSVPVTRKMPFKQWYGRLLKNQITDIVERAGERANAPKYERLDDDPPTKEEQILTEQFLLSHRGKK